MSSNESQRWLALDALSVQIESCPIIKEISFSLEKGETLVLMGPNGSGKSTLLMTLAGAQNSQLSIPPFQFQIDGHDLLHLSSEKRAELMTIVPQFPEFQVGLPVRKYLSYSRYNLLKLGHGEDEGLLGEIVEGLNLENLLNRPMEYLSGGELKRVALAAALYQNVPLIIFDEPFQALDPRVKDSIAHFLLSWQKKKNCSFIISSHDFYWSYKIADKALFLKKGEVLFYGEREKIFTSDHLKETYDIDFKWVDIEGDEGFFLPLSTQRGEVLSEGP